MDKYTFETLAFALVIVGFFMFLLGLFGGLFQTRNFLVWDSLTFFVSFYAGIGLVIIAAVLLNIARSTTEKGTDAPTLSRGPRLSERIRLRHLPIDVGTALIVGVIATAVNSFIAGDRFSDSDGFPLPVRAVNPSCFGPFPWPCFTYYPWALVLDSVIWAGLAFVVVASTDSIATRYAHVLGRGVGYRSPNPTV